MREGLGTRLGWSGVETGPVLLTERRKMKKHDVLYFFPEYSMKWEGLHSLVVHPASLEVRRREERREGGRNKGG